MSLPLRLFSLTTLSLYSLMSVAQPQVETGEAQGTVKAIITPAGEIEYIYESLKTGRQIILEPSFGTLGEEWTQVDPRRGLYKLSGSKDRWSSKIAKSLLEEAKNIVCKFPKELLPVTAQASASIGVVSISVTWETKTLCR